MPAQCTFLTEVGPRVITETSDERRDRRWEEVKAEIRLTHEVTRGQQLLIERYCRLTGTSVSAEVIWMLQAGVPLDEILPELKYNQHGVLRKPLSAWLGKLRAADDELTRITELRGHCNELDCGGDHSPAEIPCGLDLSPLEASA